MKVLIIGLYFLTACTTTKDFELNDLNLSISENSCHVMTRDKQVDWAFIRCSIKNASEEAQDVEVDLNADPSGKFLIAPTLDESLSLEKEIRSSGFNLPLAMPSISSERPELFVFTALTSIFSANQENQPLKKIVKLGSAKSMNFTFPMKRGPEFPPTRVRLHFKKPGIKSIEVPLLTDLNAETRRRAYQK